MARKDKSTPTQLGLEIDLETAGQAAVTASLFPEDGPAPEAPIAPAAPKPASGDGRSRLAALVAAAYPPQQPKGGEEGSGSGGAGDFTSSSSMVLD